MRPKFLALALGAALALCSAAAVADVPPVGFSPMPPVLTGVYTVGVSLGDFDGDGFPDLVVGRYTSTTNSVSVHTGHGDGTFGPALEVPTGLGPQRVGVGDLDADGDLDMVTTNDPSGTLSVLLGNGDGTFAPKVDYPVGARPDGIAIGDLDGDLDMDLAAGNWNSGTVSILLGTGAGTFGPATHYTVGSGVGHVAMADFNADGRLDVVAGCHGASRVVVLNNVGGGSFVTGATLTGLSSAYGVDTGDFNHDGRVDLAVDASPIVAVFLGNGDGTFQPRTTYSTGTTVIDVDVADVNLDGHPDLVVCNSGDARVSVLPGDGTGVFLPRVDFPAGAGEQQLGVGDLDRDGRPDIVTADWVDGVSGTVSILLNTSGTSVAPQAPPECLTPAHACVEVPVTIARTDGAPVRGFSVQVRLSANLSICGAGITEGTWLSAIGLTQYAVVDNLDGSYTVDCAILGLPCGAVTLSGTLFTLHLASAAPTGTGTVTVTGVTLRDCDNAPVAGWPGPPASITTDNSVPGAVVLSAAQRRTGNDANGTTVIDVSWTGTVTPGDSVLVYRAGWGNHPEYDMAGGVPAVPSYPPAAPWTLAARVAGPATLADETTPRDFWYYVAFVKDPCGNVGDVSNRTGGTLNYHLGDVSTGFATCAGDNVVDAADISALGAHYGTTLADPDAWGCLDVGPTTNGSVHARPLCDDRVGFEDLMIFAMNFAQVAGPMFASRGALAEADALWFEAPERVRAGETFTVTVRMRGAGRLQGLAFSVDADPSVAAATGFEPGDLLAAQGGLVLSPSAGRVDAAVLGKGRGIGGEGVLARVVFRALANGAPSVALAGIDARDLANGKVALVGPRAQGPAVTSFASAAPNPFRGRTLLSYSLAAEGPVELAVFAVDGRRVVTLLAGVLPVGSHGVEWNGRDASGHAARPGLYFARLTTPAGQFTRSIVLLD